MAEARWRSPFPPLLEAFGQGIELGVTFVPCRSGDDRLPHRDKIVSRRRASRRLGPSRTGIATVALASLLAVACAEVPPPDHDVPGSEKPVHAQAVTLGASPFGKYLAGRAAQSMSDTTAAADYYLNSLRSDPDNPMLVRRAYFYLLTEGRNDEAVALARKALEIDPQESVAPLVLSVDAAKRQSWIEAEDALSPLKPQGLNSFLLPLTKAWVLQGQGKTDQAIKALASLKEQDGLVQIHDFHAGMILDLAGRTAQAETYYRKTLKDESSLSLRSVQIIANFLQRSGRSQEANALFSRYRDEHGGSTLIETAHTAFKAHPDDRPLRDARDGLAEALYGAASSIVQAQALDTALAFTRLCLMARPEFPYGVMMVGDILYAQERWQAAADVFASVPKESPIYFPSRLRLAEARERLNQLSEAQAVLADLATTYPEAADPVIQLGDLERRRSNWDAAADAYRRALDRLGPTRSGAWAIHYSLGIALERGKHWADAEKSLLKALELEPEQPLVLNYLGYSWVDQGINLDKGKELIEKAAAQRPTDGFIVDSLGWVYYRLGNIERAVKELERAVELEPGDPAINDHLGDAYWAVGRKTEAVFQWKRALTLDPEPELRDAVEKKLKDGPAPYKPMTKS